MPSVNRRTYPDPPTTWWAEDEQAERLHPQQHCSDVDNTCNGQHIEAIPHQDVELLEVQAHACCHGLVLGCVHHRCETSDVSQRLTMQNHNPKHIIHQTTPSFWLVLPASLPPHGKWADLHTTHYSVPCVRHLGKISNTPCVTSSDETCAHTCPHIVNKNHTCEWHHVLHEQLLTQGGCLAKHDNCKPMDISLISPCINAICYATAQTHHL